MPSYLLLEDGDHLLLEDGGVFLSEEGLSSDNGTAQWASRRLTRRSSSSELTRRYGSWRLSR